MGGHRQKRCRWTHARTGKRRVKAPPSHARAVAGLVACACITRAAAVCVANTAPQVALVDAVPLPGAACPEHLRLLQDLGGENGSPQPEGSMSTSTLPPAHDKEKTPQSDPTLKWRALGRRRSSSGDSTRSDARNEAGVQQDNEDCTAPSPVGASCRQSSSTQAGADEPERGADMKPSMRDRDTEGEAKDSGFPVANTADCDKGSLKQAEEKACDASLAVAVNDGNGPHRAGMVAIAASLFRPLREMVRLKIRQAFTLMPTGKHSSGRSCDRALGTPSKGRIHKKVGKRKKGKGIPRFEGSDEHVPVELCSLEVPELAQPIGLVIGRESSPSRSPARSKLRVLGKGGDDQSLDESPAGSVCSATGG